MTAPATAPAPRVRVTWLYVPGDRPERFAKAVASGADVVIIDLEDAVAPARKDEARANVAAYLRERGAAAPTDGVEVHVRVNDLATQRGLDDLSELVDLPGLDAVRLPKVESPRTLDLLDHFPVPAYALLESAAGIVRAAAIAAHPRVAGVALGEQDLAAELSITDASALDHLRLQVVLAAAAAGLPPVPLSVHPHVQDERGLLASCLAGRALGLFGRAAIHPRQLPVIRQAFAPTAEETARAREIVDAAERAERDGVGAVALPDGRFVDAPVVARARRTLALADRLAPDPGRRRRDGADPGQAPSGPARPGHAAP
ncbi:HpcH/HpaI aldolase/citrate lyase family protein [Nonomuraea indica]|uniref:HpcH/HpaI aldolase/citrate lyase family protein n=1 Tax=Nonomuraea indica TaxID=1581193 RepID=UPI000C7DD9E2|nr:CoA ester lyase [Nonomuraea indica]